MNSLDTLTNYIYFKEFKIGYCQILTIHQRTECFFKVIVIILITNKINSNMPTWFVSRTLPLCRYIIRSGLGLKTGPSILNLGRPIIHWMGCNLFNWLQPIFYPTGQPIAVGIAHMANPPLHTIHPITKSIILADMHLSSTVSVN